MSRCRSEELVGLLPSGNFEQHRSEQEIVSYSFPFELQRNAGIMSAVCHEQYLEMVGRSKHTIERSQLT